jgi:hypothetical protein
MVALNFKLQITELAQTNLTHAFGGNFWPWDRGMAPKLLLPEKI